VTALYKSRHFKQLSDSNKNIPWSSETKGQQYLKNQGNSKGSIL